jgi:putative ATP-dependent endonuclease of the OLD family
MRIARLQVSKFRSIKSLDIALPQICALVGPNNTGKGNILLAIQRVLGREWVSVNAFNEQDVYGREPGSDIKISLTFEPSLTYAKFREADPAEISKLSFEYTRYKVGEQKGERRLEQKCFDSDDRAPMVLVKAPRKGEQRKYQPLVNIPAEVRELIPVIYIGTNRSLREHLPGARYSLLRQLFEDIDRDLHDPGNIIRVRAPDGTETEVSRIERYQDVMNEVLSLLKTDAFNQLESSVKRNALLQLGFDPDTDTDKLDFYFGPFATIEFYKGLDLRVREGTFNISATELGEGIQNALVLSILQAFEERRKKGAILLIEEPEMFLHPQMQRSLYRTIRRIGESNQVIYTTHSPHFVTVPDYDEVLLVRKADSGTNVQRSNLPADSKRREKLIKELDPERNELFFASRLLVVEGDTEKLALPVYGNRLRLDLDRKGATIVEVGGKRNLMEFALIARSFGIPTGVLYDEDSSDIADKKEEAELNKSLDALDDAKNDAHAWRLKKNYEDELRRTVGDENYRKLCQKFPNTQKPTRARLIALEQDHPIPAVIQTALRWLVDDKSGKK